MEVKLSEHVKKYIEKLNEPIKSRIKTGLAKIENNPPQGDIKALNGQDGFRLRIGDYRLLYEVENNIAYFYDIGLRGQIYNKRR
jgi:mRNA interferase RelE/StbE